MTDRCDLCGARLASDATECRECGTPRRIAAPIFSSPIDPAQRVPTGPIAAVASGRKKTVPLVIAVGAGLALTSGLAVGAFVLTRDAAPPPDRGDPAAVGGARACADLQALAGTWAFTTEVTSARVLSSSGINGYYTMQIETDVAACTASASVTKTGYTARRFAESDRLHGRADLERGAFGWGGVFALAEEQGGGAQDQELVFAVQGGDRLVGTWRQRGARWDKTRLSGFLDGRRDETGTVDPVLVDQPCAIRCHVACDAAARELGGAPVETCVQACERAPTEVAVCGDAQPLPDAFALALSGPHATFEAGCRALADSQACEKNPRLRKGRAPVLDDKRLDEFAQARVVRIGETPRIALETAAGWFVSDSIAAAQTEGSTLVDADLYARHLSDGAARRYVLGTVAARIDAQTRETWIACRPADPPVCIAIPFASYDDDTPPQRALVTALPGTALSIQSAIDEPPLQPGLYRW